MNKYFKLFFFCFLMIGLPRLVCALEINSTEENVNNQDAFTVNDDISKVNVSDFRFDNDSNDLKNGWFFDNGNKYYFVNNVSLEGFNTVDGKRYYFEEGSGKLLYWWHSKDGKNFYQYGDGSIKEGLQKINGLMYYVKDDYIYSGEVEINGEMYLFKEKNGEMQTGSVLLSNGKRVLVKSDGTHPKGWCIYNNDKYYVDQDGYILEGFNTIDGKRYYFEEGSGKLLYWWHSKDGKNFYQYGDGSIKEGLQKINGLMYYVKDDYIYKGQLILDGAELYFNEDNGEIRTGFIEQSNGKAIYVTNDSAPLKGWFSVNDLIYYADLDGYILTGNQKVEGRDYYFNTDGVLCGFTWENDKLYYYNPDGKKAYGVQRIAGKYYKFNEFTGAFEKMVNQRNVIDISAHNGSIDWLAVKNSGLVDAVILRLGFGYADIDKMFLHNMAELNRLNIPFSVYLFSYAANGWEADREANFVINTIRQYNVNINTSIFSIYYDLEDWVIRSTGKNSNDISMQAYGDIITTFVGKVESNLGIKTRLYSSKNYILTRFPEFTHPYATWVAQWSNTLTYDKAVEGWQYSNNGVISGITGRVDLNKFFY